MAGRLNRVVARMSLLHEVIALVTLIACHGILFIAAWCGFRALVRRNREE